MYFDPKQVFYPKADLGYVRELIDGRITCEDAQSTLSKVGIENVSFLPVKTEGIFNRVYWAIDDKGNKYVLKVYGLPEAWENEWRVTEQLFPLVEKPLYSYKKNDVTIYFYGKEPFWLLFKKSVGGKGENVASLAWKLAELHTKTQGMFKGYGWAQKNVYDGSYKGVFDRWEDYLRLNLDKHIAFCAKIGSINNGEAARIQKTFDDYCHDLSFDSCIIHNDLNPKNILYNGDEVNIIDWEDAIIGDPLYDIASHTTFAWQGFRLLSLREVPLALLDYYASKDRPKDVDLRFWLYYLRISLMKSVLLFKKGDTDYTGRIQMALKYFDSL